MGGLQRCRSARRISLPGADRAGGAVGGERHCPRRGARVAFGHVPGSHPGRDRRRPADARGAAHGHPRGDAGEHRAQPAHDRGDRRLPRLLGLEPVGSAGRAPDRGREQPDPAPGVRVHRLPPVLAAVPALLRGDHRRARGRRARRPVGDRPAGAGQQGQPGARLGDRADAADRPRAGGRARHPARGRAPRRAQHRRPVRAPDHARRGRPGPDLPLRPRLPLAVARRHVDRSLRRRPRAARRPRADEGLPPAHRPVRAVRLPAALRRALRAQRHRPLRAPGRPRGDRARPLPDRAELPLGRRQRGAAALRDAGDVLRALRRAAPDRQRPRHDVRGAQELPPVPDRGRRLRARHDRHAGVRAAPAVRRRAGRDHPRDPAAHDEAVRPDRGDDAPRSDHERRAELHRRADRAAGPRRRPVEDVPRRRCSSTSCTR